MAETQLASMRIGSVDVIDERQRESKTPAIVHIFQDNQMVGWLTKEDVLDDLHVKSLENTLETYDIQVHGHNKYVEYLADRNRITIPDEDGNLIEFIIAETKKVKGRSHTVRVLAKASYLQDIKKAKVIRPTTLNEYTVSMLTGWALDESDWQVGIIESDNYRTMTIENPTNPYEFLKRIANEFNLELRFRVEHDGNRITGRFVDLLERVGSWQGREVEFGHDLNSIERNEKTDNIVTCLVGYAPEDEDGNRLEVIVKDEEAIQRWGELWDYYEPQSSRLDMTESELRQYTRTELDKRINKVVTYKADIIDLENVPGMENKKIRFGDTIHIKDLKFNPALYLEARVFEQRRSLFKRARKQVKLGDFTEFTQEEVDAIWNQLRQQINQKIGMRELLERTYDKLTIDQKDDDVYEDGKTFAEAVGVDAKGYADTQDTALQTAVEGYADTVASTAEDNAKNYADALDEDLRRYAVAQEVYDTKMDQIAGDLADKAGIGYVDGQIQVIDDRLDDIDAEIDKKADGSTVYTIAEVDNMINNTVSVTQYTADMDGIVTDLTDHNTRIGQNEEAIGLKADQTELDTIAGTVSEHTATLDVMAGEISQRATTAEVDAIEGRLSTAEGEITTMAGQIELKADSSVVDDLGGRVTSAELAIDGLEGEITSKVDDGEVRSIFQQESEQFVFAIDDINDKLNNAVTTIDELGITVADGSFYLIDQTTGTRNHAVFKENLVRDHSFESVGVDYETHHGNNIYNAVTNTPNSWSGWVVNAGSPRIIDMYYEQGNVEAHTIFGFKTIVANWSNYMMQRVPAQENTVYSCSFYAKKAPGHEAGIPRISLLFRDFDFNLIDDVRYNFSERVTETPRRYNRTVTAPQGTVYVEIRILCTDNSSWVAIDGVEMVASELPGLYNPENSVSQLIHGQIRAKSLMTDSFRAQELATFGADVWVTGGINVASADQGAGTSNGIDFGINQHTISDYNGDWTFYGNRSVGRPFVVRSFTGTRNDRSNFRDDFWIDRYSGQIHSPPTYESTSSNSANVRIGGGTFNRFFRTTSAAKYKTDFRPVEEDADPYAILDLELYSWIDKGDIERNDGSLEGLQRHYGFIADDLVKVGLPQYVDFHEGEVEHYHERVWSLLIPIVRDHEEKITDIYEVIETHEEKIERLEKEVEKLKGVA